MTESDRIIAEVLRLDAEATKGPWNHIDGDGSVWRDDENQTCIANTDHCPNDNMDANAEMIAAYRTAAPRLARMLKMHQELTNGIVNGTQPPWLDEAKKLKETRPYESLESKAARYVLNKCDEIAKGEA